MPTMTYPTTAGEQTYIEVTGGVDTHKDASGRLLGHREFAATAAGYAALLAWLGTLGQLVRVGVEGSGVYGAGLARSLQAAGVELVEVDRPDRKTPRVSQFLLIMFRRRPRRRGRPGFLAGWPAQGMGREIWRR